MAFKNYKELGKKYGIGEDKWLNLEEGNNRVRIVSEFIDYGSHYNKETNKSIICIGKEHCELCKQGNKARIQFLGWVIDRKDGQIKLLRIGYKIYTELGKLSETEDYAFDIIPDYDITIVRSGRGLDTEYSVIPARNNTPLTEEEQKAIIEKVKNPEEIINAMKARIAFSDDEDGESVAIEIES